MPLALRSQTDEQNRSKWLRPDGLRVLFVFASGLSTSTGQRPSKMLQLAEGDLYWSLKGSLVHINAMGEKRGNLPLEVVVR